MTGIASNIKRDVGLYPLVMTLPILTNLSSTKFGAMFLGIILNMIIFVLFMLSLMLLYNLLLVSIETKNFELAVLRTLGLNKLGIIFLIIVQCLSYVIPAVISGMLIAIPGLEVIGNALKKSLGVKISNLPTANAVLFGLVIGILIPIFSSIFPIK